jgi:hypothetical protein
MAPHQRWEEFLVRAAAWLLLALRAVRERAVEL